MIETICGFNIQTNTGEMGKWSAHISVLEIPTPDEIDAFVDAIDEVYDNYTLIDCFAIYTVDGREIWTSQEMTQEEVLDMFMIHIKDDEDGE